MLASIVPPPSALIKGRWRLETGSVYATLRFLDCIMPIAKSRLLLLIVNPNMRPLLTPFR
jgi:hypothetical protein